MGAAFILVHGVPYVTLPAIAASFDVELSWVEEVYDYGLLGEGERIDGLVAVEARLLERVGAIRRLSVQQGVNLPGIAIILDLMESAP